MRPERLKEKTFPVKKLLQLLRARDGWRADGADDVERGRMWGNKHGTQGSTDDGEAATEEM